MVIQDFVAVFDRLDTAQRGFVTVDQVVGLHEAVYLTPVAFDHVEAAVVHVCGQGHDGKVTRDAFLPVLEEVARRQAVEEQVYWDFQALDFNGSHRIRLRDALTLFQEYHGDLFSLDTWRHFLHSRLDPASDVYFDEIRDWLCSMPSGKPASDADVKDELSRIDKSHWDQFRQDFDALETLKKGDGEEDDQYFDDTKRHAHRKLQKWNHQGLGAMLMDDGLDTEGESTVKPTRRRDAVSVTDLMDAMETKYALLMDALVMHMASFAANMDSEKPELMQQIHRAVSKLSKDSKAGTVDTLPGSSAMLPLSLHHLMGFLPPGHRQHTAQLETLRHRLVGEGKSAADIDHILKTEYDSWMDGPLDCGQAVQDLLKRKQSEKEWLVSVSRGQEGEGKASWSELCRLQRQIVIMKDLHLVVPAALAVGIAERPQKYQHQIYSPDRERCERLARERLQERQGHALIRTTSQLPDIAEIEKLGGVNIRSDIVAETELRFHLEREALMFMLQGPGSNERKGAAQKLSEEERRKRLSMLRSHHLNWKMGKSGDPAQNFSILEEAVGLYWVERRADIEKQQHNVSDMGVSGAVLADLLLRQEMDFAHCLDTMAGKKATGLVSVLKQESRTRFQEHFNNIVAVVLGVVDLSDEDKEYLDALTEKYRAMRDQVFVFALKDRLGHSGWNNLGREGRQGELLKLRKEEKKLRGDGRLMDMAAIVGAKSQALPALTHLLGENKGYGKGSTSTPVTTKPMNLLGDLVPRFDLEQENLLTWLHSEEVKTTEGLTHKLRELTGLEMERFGVGVEGDYEAGLMAVGLMERLQTVPTGRSKSDRDKQQALARKRVALRKWRLRQNEPYKIPAEDKTPPTSGDKLSWCRAVVREMVRGHAVERELLLRVLQDGGFGDLVEAAGLLVVEERWQRQAQLAEKYHALNLASPDGREEHLTILEEAAALRVVGVRALARQQEGKSLKEDEVGARLMTELQDIHDTELAEWLINGPIMDEDALQQKLDSGKKSRAEEHAGSVMTVLSRVDGDSDITNVFIKIVDEKYQALRDALLLSSVVRAGGERQSQKQRDKRLQALSKEVAPHWDTGDAEQVATLLGPDWTLDHPVSWLLGMERSKFTKDRDSGDIEIIKEAERSEDTGVLAAIKHLMQRYTDEKEHLLSALAGANGQFLSENMKVTLKSRLRRERSVTACEEGLTVAALACGLAERQAEVINGIQLERDRERYGMLGRHEFRARQAGREGRSKKDSLTVERKDNREILQDAVLSLLQKKHTEERQLLAEMLTNPRFEHVQRETALESSQQRKDRLAVLRSRRQAASLESSSDNLALLQEALVVLREVQRGQKGRGSSPEDDFDLNCDIMAALLQWQNCEAEQYLGDFITEELSDLIESQEQILEELRKNHCLNIAALIFTPAPATQGEGGHDPLVEALDGKYDALRDKLLMQALIDQMGEEKWRNMSERERQRRLMELKLKERQLRRDGKLDELAALLGDAINNEATLKKLLGENRDEYERKLRERLEKRRQRLADGMSEEECDRLEKEEEEREEEEARQRRRNVLQDLEHNYDQERDALLQQLKDSQDGGERERQKRLLQLRLEQRRLRRDDDLHSASLLLHQQDQLSKDKAAERHRQEQLAKERLEAARLRKKGEQRQQDDQQLKVIANDLDTEDDRSKLQEMALTALDLKHQSERDLLMTLLDEKCTGRQSEAISDMDTANLATQLQELGDVFRQWRDSGKPGSAHSEQESLQLLGEAIVYSVELKKRQLKSEGKSSTESNVHISLLADLQEIQEKESSETMASAIDMDEERLRQLTRSIIKKKESGCHENVAEVLLQPGGRSEDEESKEGEEDEEGLSEEEKEQKRVVKALEMKYDALRDKVIIEALIQQYGEAEWKRLSELERQRKLAEMKRTERQLRQQGKMDEIEELLGQHLKHKQDLDSMLGESQEEQKRRLQERLARRRQLQAEREAEGLSVDEATLDAIQDKEEEAERAKRQNVLENLQMHFEDEKAALLAALSGHADERERERARQRALVQLQRDRKRLQAEEQLDSAALIFHMGQQQQDSLLKERERQRHLARERLMQRRRQILEGKEVVSEDTLAPPLTDDDVPEDTLGDGLQPLQEGVLMAFDKHQAAELDTLQQLLAKCRRDKDAAKHLKSMSDEELRLKLTRSEKEYALWRKESAKKVTALEDPRLPAKRRNKLTQKAVQRFKAQMDILGQALAHKLELERRQLEKVRAGSKEEELWEEMCIMTLADLQERQMMLFNTVQDSVFSKTKEDLETMRKTQRAANREGWFDSLSGVVFSVEDMGGEELSLNDRREAEARLQADFLQQKQDILAKAKREGLDPEAMLRDLEAQHAMKRKKLQEDMERQRSEVKKRLEARRQRQMDSGYEAEAVMQMLKQAENQSQAAQDRASTERGNQKSLLQERLQQRRDARKRAAQISQQDKASMQAPMPGSDGIPRSDSVSTSSSMGLKREKTIIDTSVSDDQKQAIYNQLVKQQLNEQISKTAQRQKQEEELKRRLEARKGQRENEAAALFSLGERQKTFLEQAKKGEHERQIAQMRERVSRVKYERTKTRRMSSPGLPLGRGFADEAIEEGDDSMDQKAQQLEERFKREAHKPQDGQEGQSVEPKESTPLTDKSRMDILKERRMQKKQQRQGGKD